jgi:hypothetical protein
MATKKTVLARRPPSSPGNLSKKELALVDAIVAEIQANDFKNLDMASWNEAREGLKKVPIGPDVDPELRKALAKAVEDLKDIPAPTLKNLLQLWHGATAYRVSQGRSKLK